MTHSFLRLDIQFLRGIAILAVLVYHAEVVTLGGGYLGVDIFFVISGYLITSIILKDVAACRFSFLQFYARRAKRLLPAAYCTLIFSTFLSAKILTPAQWDDFVKQLIGAVTFTANIVLPLQTGYFETAAEGKALLHTWSLSVEEQYYLCIPLVLYLTRPRWHLIVLIIAALISLIACIGLVSFPYTYWRIPSIDSKTAAFYFLPTRAWEMLAGSLLAWLMLKSPGLSLPKLVKLFALLLIGYLCVFPLDSGHPRENAILMVLGTSILIAGDSTWLPQNLLTRSIGRIGDWSYSLYLVHWPLFALARNAYLGEIPTHVKVLLVFVAIHLAYLQFEYVEQRFRYGWRANKAKTIKWFAGASVAVVLSPISMDFIRQPNVATSLNNLGSANWGFKEGCAAGKLVFDSPKECSTSDKPKFALWGDSYTMHLIPGLKQEKLIAESMIQITKAACAPILGVASLDSNYDEAWAKKCLAFNDKAISFIENSQSIKYVIMSSPYSGYFDNGDLMLFYDGKKIVGHRSIAIERMVGTVNRLTAHDKVPILVAPPPRPGFNIGECWQRKNSGLLILGRSDCNFRSDEYLTYQRGVIDSLAEVQSRSHTELLRFDGIFCKNGYCKTLLGDGTSIYTDGGHLSTPGSEWAVPKLGLTRIARQNNR